MFMHGHTQNIYCVFVVHSFPSQVARLVALKRLSLACEVAVLLKDWDLVARGVWKAYHLLLPLLRVAAMGRLLFQAWHPGQISFGLPPPACLAIISLLVAMVAAMKMLQTSIHHFCRVRASEEERSKVGNKPDERSWVS